MYRRARLLVSPTISEVKLTDQQRPAQAPIGVRSYVSEPDRGRRHWKGQPAADSRRARETAAAAAGRVAGTAQRASLRDRPDAPRPSTRASQHSETAARPGLRRQSRVAHAAPDGRRHAAEPPGPRVGAGGGTDRPPELVLGAYAALLGPRAPRSAGFVVGWSGDTANTDTRFSIDNQPLLPRAASPTGHGARIVVS